MGWTGYGTGGSGWPGQPAGESAARASVLIIDSDTASAASLACALGGEGYQVAIAGSGPEALRLAAQRRFDLVVVDLRLRGALDGAETLTALKRVDEAIGVIVTAVAPPPEAALSCLRRGAWALVPKPPRLEEMQLLLDRALEHRRLRAAVELYEASHALLSSLSSDELRASVLELARRVLRSPSAVLLLRSSGGDWEVHTQGEAQAEASHLARELFTQGAPLPARPWSGRLSERAETSHGRFDRVLTYPLLVRGQTIGLLVVLRFPNSPAFTALEEDRGGLFSTHAALALDNARIYQSLERIAVIDELTGLHSRRYLFDIVRRSRPEDAPSGTSFLMVDVDHFKQVNDRWGHSVGDRVLRRVAELLVSATRDSDVVARVGGEEFAVLLPQTDEETATDVAERVRAAIALHTVDPAVTVSVGVSTLPGALLQVGQDPIERAALLMERADGALYRAKRAGRNRVCVWRARRREFAGA